MKKAILPILTVALLGVSLGVVGTITAEAG